MARAISQWRDQGSGYPPFGVFKRSVPHNVVVRRAHGGDGGDEDVVEHRRTEDSVRNAKGRGSGGIPDSGRARVRGLECKTGRMTGGGGQTAIGSYGMSADEKVVMG